MTKMRPVSSMSTFSGLTSRWMRPRAWACCSALVSCAMILNCWLMSILRMPLPSDDLRGVPVSKYSAPQTWLLTPLLHHPHLHTQSVHPSSSSIHFTVRTQHVMRTHQSQESRVLPEMYCMPKQRGPPCSGSIQQWTLGMAG